MKGQGRAERTLALMMCFPFFPLLVMTHKSAEETRLSSVERVRVVGFRPSEVSKEEASVGNIKSPSLNNHRRE